MNILKRLFRPRQSRRREADGWYWYGGYSQMPDLRALARGVVHIGPMILSAYISEIQLLTPEKLRRVRQFRHLIAQARRLPR